MAKNLQSIAPANDVALITKNDSTTFPATRGVSFVTVGDLKVTTAEGTDVVIPSGALAAGIIHPLSITKIFSTGTAAAGFVVYY